MPLQNVLKRLLPGRSAGPEDQPGPQSVAPAATSEAATSARGLIADGRYADALAAIDAALAKRGNDAELLFARAAALYAWGRVHESHEAAFRASTLGLATPELYRNLGWICIRISNVAHAATWMRKAVQAGSQEWLNHFGLGVALHMQGNVQDAIDSQRRALAIKPDAIDALNALINCHLALDDAAGAEREARNALRIDERNPQAWTNLGVALMRQQRFDEAREPFERAGQVEAETGQTVDSFIQYCAYLRDNGQTARAIEIYERALSVHPNAAGQGDYALALLRAGNYVHGWRHYDFRWLNPPFLGSRPSFGVPQWTGQDLRGRTIALRVEQGFGDTFQFIRYAPAVKGLGARVVLLATPALERVMRTCAGVDSVIAQGALPPVDYWASLMSLPKVFGTTLESIPASVPYLNAEPDLVERWRKRLPEGVLRVGLVWGGNPAHANDRARSIALTALKPLLGVEGVKFFSLQKGPQAAQLQATDALDLLDMGRELEDFADTAAVISQLDLVVCVDTSIAHLAGALGKPVWILLPFSADFRWLEGREDTPWYPTMRLFRQDASRTWEATVARVRDALQRWARGSVDTVTQQSSSDTALLPLSEQALLNMDWNGLSGVAETRHGLMQCFPDERAAENALWFYGEHRDADVNLLSAIVARGATVLEANAGVGEHALPLTHIVGPAGHVFAMEPDARRCAALRRNLAGRGNVTVLQRALSREPGGPVDSVDALRLARLDLLKVAERADAAAIVEGATEAFRGLRPKLFVTLEDVESLQRLSARMREFGYRCWQYEVDAFHPGNYNRRRINIFADTRVVSLLAMPPEMAHVAIPAGCVELAAP